LIGAGVAKPVSLTRSAAGAGGTARDGSGPMMRAFNLPAVSPERRLRCMSCWLTPVSVSIAKVFSIVKNNQRACDDRFVIVGIGRIELDQARNYIARHGLNG